MPFTGGDRAEVAKTEPGFEESFYLANVISDLHDGTYIVQYRTLIDDGGFAPLREIANEEQLKPVPPEISVAEHKIGATVDANYRDGWWTGKVVRVVGTTYVVYFKYPPEEIEFPFEKLRVHQDWNNGAVFCFFDDGYVW